MANGGGVGRYVNWFRLHSFFQPRSGDIEEINLYVVFDVSHAFILHTEMYCPNMVGLRGAQLDWSPILADTARCMRLQARVHLGEAPISLQVRFSKYS